MTNLMETLTELQQMIESSIKPSTSYSLPEIAESAIPNEQLVTIVNALLTEGDLHRSDTWASHMTPAISNTSLLGQLLSGLHNGNLLSPKLYPLLAEIEQQLITWLCRLFHQQHGHFVAGSSYANLEALWQAKQYNANASRVVYASNAVHYSVAKACQILDLELKYIATNEHGELITDDLRNACQQQPPLAIVATLGTTATGVMDPIEACIALCQQFHAWCHVDAAWGGALALLPEYKALFNLFSQANSVCFDPHKSWQQPKPASVLLYQRPLSPMLTADSNYLEQTPNNSLPGSRGGELFLPLWLTVMSGVDTLRIQTQQRLKQASLFADLLTEQSDWLVYRSDTGIICFEPHKATDLTELVEQGTFSQAQINNKKVYRAVFTTAETKAHALFTVLKPYL